jgi:hypothetical protein
LIKCRRNGKQKLERFCGRNVQKDGSKSFKDSGRNVEEMGNKSLKDSGRNVQEMETQKKSFQDSGRYVEDTQAHVGIGRHK